MKKLNYVDGNLIDLALAGKFDAIAHGCNCKNKMGKGIAKEFAERLGALRCDTHYRSILSNVIPSWQDIELLGNIDYYSPYGMGFTQAPEKLRVINAYTQYDYRGDSGIVNFNYSAGSLCLKKINKIFKGAKIGLPKIGAGLAAGDWELIEKIIEAELVDCDVTIVNYVK